MAVYSSGHAAGHSPWCILPKGYNFDVWKVEVTGDFGGDKTGDGRFYERMISAADRLYDEHIKQLRKEGLIP